MYFLLAADLTPYGPHVDLTEAPASLHSLSLNTYGVKPTYLVYLHPQFYLYFVTVTKSYMC